MSRGFRNEVTNRNGDMVASPSSRQPIALGARRPRHRTLPGGRPMPSSVVDSDPDPLVALALGIDRREGWVVQAPNGRYGAAYDPITPKRSNGCSVHPGPHHIVFSAAMRFPP